MMRRLRAMALLFWGFGAATATAAPPHGDVVQLVTGDRISGKIIARGTKRVRIQTPYGLLVIPKSEIVRILGADGVEELLATPSEEPDGKPAVALPLPLKLSLVVKGASFWQAWDSRAAPADPSIRLVLRLDEMEIAAWSDAALDEGEIKGAVVNAFSFEPGSLDARALADGVRVRPPATSPGRIVLHVELPTTWAGSHRLGVAYQSSGTSGETKAWRDLAWTVGHAELTPETATVVTLSQDGGTMEYSGFTKKKMKNVETFRLELHTE